MSRQPKRPHVMIRCPFTNKPLKTGIAMDQASFASSTLEANTIGPCPHCGEDHLWSKDDAYIAEVR